MIKERQKIERKKGKMNKKEEERATQEFEDLSKDAQAVKAKIVEGLAAMHEDLCELARIERAMEVARQAGGRTVAPILEEYSHKLSLPTSKVWAQVDGLMQMINQLNNSATAQAGGAELPEIFKNKKRIVEFTKGKQK